LGQVSIRIGGRSFRLSCGEGEEARLAALGDYINGKVRDLVEVHGNIGEDRLLVMAALLITDELFEAREPTVEQDADEFDEAGGIEPDGDTGAAA
jgi:cell division protein ZapA